MSSVVYWIHLAEHTNILTEGYIGVTNNIKSRFRSHEKRTGNKHFKRAIKKYGWDNLVKEIVLISDKAYCLLIEAKLRSKANTGWNVAIGGGNPPHENVWNKGRVMPKDELEIMKAKGFGFNKGNKPWNAGIKLTEEQKAKIYDIGSYTKGKTAHNKGQPMSLEHKQKLLKIVVCPHCNKEGNAGNIARYHMDKCKYKGASS